MSKDNRPKITLSFKLFSLSFLFVIRVNSGALQNAIHHYKQVVYREGYFPTPLLGIPVFPAFMFAFTIGIVLGLYPA